MANDHLDAVDFSAGFTDDYLAGPINRAQILDNLLIDSNKKAFTRPGSELEDSAAPQVLNGTKRVSNLFVHRDFRMKQSESHIYYNSSGYVELKGPSGNPAFPANTVASHISRTFWNNHTFLVSDSGDLPIKIYLDGSDTFQLRTAGMPALTAPTVTAGAAGVNNYIYAFLYYYTYSVEGVTFEDFGPTTQVQLSNAAAPDASTVAITNIPVISNGATKNYDTANIKVKIYRTENDQTVLKFIGEVTNGTTTYNDSASDTSITDNVTIYTSGGVVDNDSPAPAKFIHRNGPIVLYGGVTQSSIQYPNRLLQAIPDDPDSVPASFLLDMPQDIFGISSFKGTFLVFCEDSVHRVDSSFDELGRNGLVSQTISDTVGCVSNDSIIQTDYGLFFMAKQGVHFCDGYSVRKISIHLDITYPKYVATDTMARNIYGDYDKIENRIWWGVQTDPSSLDNDTHFILDLNWGITSESSFQTASNGDSYSPTATLFHDGNLYRADRRGYVFKHADNIFTDLRVDIGTLPSTWVKKTIIHRYRSCAFDFGTSFVRKFVSKVLLSLKNVTNIAVQVISINDDGRQTTNLKEIRYNNNIVWGDPNLIWGTASLIWNQTQLIEEKRHFPARNLRCNYKQIEITNSYTVVTNSDTLSSGTLDATLKTLTLTDLTEVWPADSVDYYLSFENDSYDTQFLVTIRNSDSKLTFIDTLGETPVSGSYKWLLKGYRKGEKLNILSYVIHYKFLSDSQKSYHVPADTGLNS